MKWGLVIEAKSECRWLTTISKRQNEYRTMPNLTLWRIALLKVVCITRPQSFRLPVSRQPALAAGIVSRGHRFRRRAGPPCGACGRGCRRTPGWHTRRRRPDAAWPGGGRGCSRRADRVKQGAMSLKRICTACLLPKSCNVRRRAASTGAIALFHSAQPGPCRHFFHSSLFRSPSDSSRAAASSCGKARIGDRHDAARPADGLPWPSGWWSRCGP